MKNIVDNHVHAIKEFIRDNGIKDIISVKHLGDFIFEAITSDSRIEIITEPVDKEEKQVKILSMKIHSRHGEALTCEEQELLIYVAKYNSDRVCRFFTTDLCNSRYSVDDIESFKLLLASESNSAAVKAYWDLDTAAIL